MLMSIVADVGLKFVTSEVISRVDGLVARLAAVLNRMTLSEIKPIYVSLSQRVDGTIVKAS